MSVYFIASDDMQRVKIGKTNGRRNAHLRLAELIRSSPYLLLIVGEIFGESHVEAALHGRFASTRLHGEWFRTSAELEALIAEVQAVGCGWSGVHYPLHLQADGLGVDGEALRGRCRYTARDELRRVGFRMTRPKDGLAGDTPVSSQFMKSEEKTKTPGVTGGSQE